MEQLHNNLMQSSDSYAKWHANPKHHHIHWGAVIIIVLFVGALLLGSVKSWRDTVYDTITINFRHRSATLTLTPNTKEVKVGEILPVAIMLDTNNEPVDGVDLYSIHFDPKVFTVIDDDSKKAGVQIAPGNILTVNALNTVDNKTGIIKFSQATSGGTTFSGNGALATIHFKALVTGTSSVKFDYTMGSTKDTNVAFGGRDQLTKVVDGLYTVK
jgi:hypothetical protein